MVEENRLSHYSMAAEKLRSCGIAPRGSRGRSLGSLGRWQVAVRLVIPSRSGRAIPCQGRR